MAMDFTNYLWLNWVLAGFYFGIGWLIAQAIYSAILWVLGQRRQP